MSNKRRSNEEKVVPAKNIPFHGRFQISLQIGDIKRRFLNRVKNQIFRDFFVMEVDDYERTRLALQVANRLGEEYRRSETLEAYSRSDFYITLQVLEFAYHALVEPKIKNRLSRLISSIIRQSEVDIGITWKDGYFLKKGAQLLDEHLVNEPLRWLTNPRYSSVHQPYQRGLERYLKCERDPSQLPDVITDIYQALEALAKVITGRPDKDLSSNAEIFMSKVAGNKHHKGMLKAYIAYANEFRHAVGPRETKRKPDSPEVENFIYLTGVFIRLAIERFNKVKRTE